MDVLKDYFKNTLDNFSKNIFQDISGLLSKGNVCEGAIFLGAKDPRVLNYLSDHLNAQFENQGIDCYAFSSQIVPEGVKTYNSHSGLNDGYYFLVSVDYFLNNGTIRRIPTFDRLVSSYVYEAFDLLDKRSFSLEQFEEELHTKVSQTYGLDKKLLKHLYPIFHYEFFTHQKDSTFLLNPSTSKESNFEASINFNVGKGNLSFLVDLILDKDLILLMSNVSAFYDS